MAILDKNGRPISPPKPGAVSDIIGSTGQSQDITRSYFDSLLRSQDKILATQGGGGWKALDIYKKVKSDDQVKSCWQQRSYGLISRDWRVEVGLPKGREPGTQEEKAADFVREILQELAWDNICELMQWGRFYGYAVAELFFEKDGRYITLNDIKVRDRSRFGFAPNKDLIMISPTQNINLSELYPGKFWVLSVGADHSDEPYGLGLAHWLYWLVLFKQGNLTAWQLANSRTGAPILIGEFPPGTLVQDQNKLLQTLQALKSDSGAIIPQGTIIRFLEAQRNGTGDFARLYELMNEGISKVILSQTMTTEDGSSLAQAQVHERVASAVCKADADLINESFRCGPLSWLVAWNFGDGVAAPIVSRVFDEPEDTAKLAQRDKILFDMGYALSTEYVSSIYGDGFVPKGGDNPGLSQAQVDAITKLLQSQLPPKTIQALLQAAYPALEPGVVAALVGGIPAPPVSFSFPATDRVMGGWLHELGRPAFAALLETIRQELDKANSLEEALERIDRLYPELDGKALTKLIAEGLYAVQLAGLAEVQNERP